MIFSPPSVLQLIRELGNVNVKKKELPFCYPYSVKAMVLVLSHLARIKVSEELGEGKRHNDLLKNRTFSKCKFSLNSRPTLCNFCLFQIRGL